MDEFDFEDTPKAPCRPQEMLLESLCGMKGKEFGGYLPPATRSASKRWKTCNEPNIMIRLDNMHVIKKENAQMSKEEARHIIRKIPVELLAKEWLSKEDATVDMRAYLVDHVLPTLILGVERLLKEVDDKGLCSTDRFEPEFNPLNFLAQYLMRNNPRFSNFAEASPYVRGLREVSEEIKQELFTFEDNRLARIKAEARRKRHEREKIEQQLKAEKERRSALLLQQFEEWNTPSDNGLLELSLLQNALRSFADIVEKIPKEVGETVKFGAFLEATDETGKTLNVLDFTNYTSKHVDGLPVEIFSEFMSHMKKCATKNKEFADRENRRVILTNLFILCDHGGSFSHFDERAKYGIYALGLLGRQRILSLFEQFWDQEKEANPQTGTLRNPRKWPVIEVSEIDDTMFESKDEPEGGLEPDEEKIAKQQLQRIDDELKKRAIQLSRADRENTEKWKMAQVLEKSEGLQKRMYSYGTGKDFTAIGKYPIEDTLELSTLKHLPVNYTAFKQTTDLYNFAQLDTAAKRKKAAKAKEDNMKNSLDVSRLMSRHSKNLLTVSNITQSTGTEMTPKEPPTKSSALSEEPVIISEENYQSTTQQDDNNSKTSDLISSRPSVPNGKDQELPGASHERWVGEILSLETVASEKNVPQRRPIREPISESDSTDTNNLQFVEKKQPYGDSTDDNAAVQEEFKTAEDKEETEGGKEEKGKKENEEKEEEKGNENGEERGESDKNTNKRTKARGKNVNNSSRKLNHVQRKIIRENWEKSRKKSLQMSYLALYSSDSKTESESDSQTENSETYFEVYKKLPKIRKSRKDFNNNQPMRRDFAERPSRKSFEMDIVAELAQSALSSNRQFSDGISRENTGKRKSYYKDPEMNCEDLIKMLSIPNDQFLEYFTSRNMNQNTQIQAIRDDNYSACHRARTVRVTINSRSQSQMSAFDENNLNVSQFVQLTETFIGRVPNYERFKKLVKFIKDGYEETEDEKMERLVKARKEAIAAKRKMMMDNLFEKWDNDGAGFLEIEDVLEVVRLYKDGQELDAINRALNNLKKKSKYQDQRLTRKEFRQFIELVSEELPGMESFEYFVEFLTSSVERSYAERIRGEARKKWLNQIVVASEISGFSLDCVYRTVFQALYKDAEAHGGEKKISASIAMLETNGMDPRRGELLLRYTACTAEDCKYMLGKTLFKNMKGISFEAAESGKPVHAPKVTSHGNVYFWNYDRAAEDREGSFIAVPIKDQKKRVFGVLGVDTMLDRHRRSIFITHEIQFFQGVSKSFSIAYHNVELRRKLLRITESAIAWIQRRCPHVTEITIYMVEPSQTVEGQKVLRKVMSTLKKGGNGLEVSDVVRLERKDNLFRDYLFKCMDNSETVTADAYGERRIASPLRNTSGTAIGVLDLSIGNLKKLPIYETKEAQRMLRLLQQAFAEISSNSEGDESSHILEVENNSDSRLEVLFDRLMLQELRENISKLEGTSFSELKSYKSPPPIIMDILRATLSLFYIGRAGDGDFEDWLTVKSLVNSELIQQIKTFDPTKCADHVKTERIQRYIRATFNVPHGEVAKHGSIPAQQLYNYIHVVVSLIEHSIRMRDNAKSLAVTIPDKTNNANETNNALEEKPENEPVETGSGNEENQQRADDQDIQGETTAD